MAFFATAVGTDSVKAVPWIGEWLMQVLRGMKLELTKNDNARRELAEKGLAE